MEQLMNQSDTFQNVTVGHRKRLEMDQMKRNAALVTEGLKEKAS